MGMRRFGTITAFVLYLIQLFDPIGRFTEWLGEFRQGLAALAKIVGLLEVPVAITQKPTAVELPHEPRRDEGPVRHERVEAAELSDVRELDAVDVVRRRARLGGDPHHVVRRNEQELGVAIDEARDQPRTCDTIDLGTFARYPFHVPLRRAE